MYQKKNINKTSTSLSRQYLKDSASAQDTPRSSSQHKEIYLFQSDKGQRQRKEIDDVEEQEVNKGQGYFWMGDLKGLPLDREETNMKHS